MADSITLTRLDELATREDLPTSVRAVATAAAAELRGVIFQATMMSDACQTILGMNERLLRAAEAMAPVAAQVDALGGVEAMTAKLLLIDQHARRYAHIREGRAEVVGLLTAVHYEALDQAVDASMQLLAIGQPH